MRTPDISDPLFLESVEAIDAGDLPALKDLLNRHPEIVKNRLDHPVGGYFKDPYLLWFVADNPIRNEKLPSNIVEVTRLLIKTVKREAGDSMQQQMDYALALVATGRTPKECGVQIEMMDVLIDAGAKPGGGLGVFANGNIQAGRHLIKRGGKLTMAAAVCLDDMEDVKRLIASANKNELLTALTAAAFFGNSRMITYLLGKGVDPNGYPKSDSGFHSHATPLHQAVNSGSLDAVKLLVKAGAKLDAADNIYNGTPYDWAEHMKGDEHIDGAIRKKYKAIVEYLATKK